MFENTPTMVHDNILFNTCIYDDVEELRATSRVGYIRIEDKLLAYVVPAYSNYTFLNDCLKHIRRLQDIFSVCLPINKQYSDYDASMRILALSYMFDEHDEKREVPLYTWWYGRNGALLCAVL